LADVELTLDDYQNSQETIYNFMIVPTVPIKQTNRLAIKFPEQIALPK